MPEARDQQPQFSRSQTEEFIASHYDLHGELTPLPSERDQNFLLRVSPQEAWVLKIANADTPPKSLKLQTEITRHLQERLPDDRFPQAHPKTFQLENPSNPDRSFTCRLAPYVEGIVWADYRPITTKLFQSLGSLLGRVSEQLKSFQHPGAQRHLQWDLHHCSPVVRTGLAKIVELEHRELVEWFLHDYEIHHQKNHHAQRRSVIHGDANDHNLIIDPNTDSSSRQISLIDFGDTVESETINELAIALAYAAFATTDLASDLATVVAGFHLNFPLSEEEIDLLPSLVAMRACTTLTQAAIGTSLTPDDPYVSISVQPALELLQKLKAMPQGLLSFHFRKACGLPAHPHSTRLQEWLHRIPKGLGPLVDIPLNADSLHFLDLGVGSPTALASDSPQAIDQATRKIADQLFESGASVGIGNYNEARFCYRAPQFQTAEGKRRTVHLGIDLFLEPGINVKSPLPGKVIAAHNNEAPQDYGPTVILEHEFPEQQLRFFTLYGHLGAESITHLHPGKAVQVGEIIGCIGPPFENGGWPPHLHFQVMVDMLGHKNNFPGVADPDHLDTWLELCPDPSPLAGIPSKTSKASQEKAERISKQRAGSVSPSLSLSYREPLHIVQGLNQYLYDTDGREYLDCVNNVCHVGHSHPHVVNRIAEQAATLNTNTRYLHENLTRYTERLTSLFPDPLNVCFLVCSGSEANDLALRLARQITGTRETIVLDGAYHGNLTSTLEISPYKFKGPGGFTPPPYVHTVSTPDPFRGKFRHPDTNLAAHYAQEVSATIQSLSDKNLGPPVFIAESVLSCAGQIVLPDDYLADCYNAVHAAGGICIADEVQVGFGRIGSSFWGFQSQNVIPDIVTLGKPIGNGHPMGAVITTREITDRFNNGMEYFNTFGGNPVSCAAGLAVLDVLENEGLQKHAKNVGDYLLQGLKKLAERFDCLGDVRGLGLFIGIEFVADPDRRTPSANLASYAVERMKTKRILLSTDGPDHNVIKIKPPLPFTKSDAERLITELEAVLHEHPIKHRTPIGS